MFVIIDLESAAYDQLHYGECGEYRLCILAILNVIYNSVCGLKKNKRPREDPAANGGTRGGKRKTKRKSKKNKKKRTRRAVKNIEKKKTQRTEDDDVSAQRTGLIWPWLASVTISNEVSEEHE